MSKIFIVREVKTGKIFSTRKGKSSWGSVGAAKLAWNYDLPEVSCDDEGKATLEIKKVHPELNPVKGGYRGYRWVSPKFGEQTIWEVVELKSSDEGLLETCSGLLHRCIGELEDSPLKEEILTFFKEEIG